MDGIDVPDSQLETAIGSLLKSNGLWLGTVESATGGMISQQITSIAGSSEYYAGSLITYSNTLKIHLAGVSQTTLERFGAVSRQVAAQMARGGLRALQADICLADTGIAGPGGGSRKKPVGLVYISVADYRSQITKRFEFTGSRPNNRQAFTRAALKLLHEFILDRYVGQKEL